MFLPSFQILVGLLLLTVGGHYLVEGATRIALRARLSPMVVGLTIVALGTSMPELAVSLGAAFRGSTDISYANVVGSNIFNVAAVLGVTALIWPIPVKGQTIRAEYPFMVLALFATLVISRDGTVDRLDGVLLLAGLAGFFVFMLRLSRGQPPDQETVELQRDFADMADATGGSSRALFASIAMVGIGIATLVGGADLMVRGAVSVAERFGITERVIGLTIVAGSTSLPELAATLAAASKGRPGIALGNVIGSNIFNVLCILGTTSLLVEIPVNPRAIALDNWVMVGLALALFVFLARGQRVTRWEAALLLASFVAYMGYVVTVG